jgi:Carboxypeptidase regulatory-like domain
MPWGFMLSVGLCALQLLLNTPANAAAASAVSQRVSGTIIDGLGRPVNGAELILQSQDGHIIARAKSDHGGHFEFADIRPGTYIIVANKQGFATATSIETVTAHGAKPVDISIEAQTALNMQVIAKWLDVARNGPSGRSAMPTAAAQYYFRDTGDDGAQLGTLWQNTKAEVVEARYQVAALADKMRMRTSLWRFWRARFEAPSVITNIDARKNRCFSQVLKIAEHGHAIKTLVA